MQQDAGDQGACSPLSSDSLAPLDVWNQVLSFFFFSEKTKTSKKDIWFQTFWMQQGAEDQGAWGTCSLAPLDLRYQVLSLFFLFCVSKRKIVLVSEQTQHEYTALILGQASTSSPV